MLTKIENLIVHRGEDTPAVLYRFRGFTTGKSCFMLSIGTGDASRDPVFRTQADAHRFCEPNARHNKATGRVWLATKPEKKQRSDEHDDIYADF